MATAVEVERFRRKTGELPDMLRELTPSYLRAIPIDPFDGREVRYVRRADGYRVYSVGSNCSDEGGAGAFSGNDEDIVVDAPIGPKSRAAAQERHATNRVSARGDPIPTKGGSASAFSQVETEDGPTQ